MMNMNNFPGDVWELHRKLFHRYMKYKRYFVKATQKLSELNVLTEVKADPEPETQPTTQSSITTQQAPHVINLLSSSDGEVSEDTVEDSGTEYEDVDELFEQDV